MNTETALIIGYLVGALTTLLIGTWIDRKQFRDLSEIMKIYIRSSRERREEWQRFKEWAETMYESEMESRVREKLNAGARKTKTDPV